MRGSKDVWGVLFPVLAVSLHALPIPGAPLNPLFLELKMQEFQNISQPGKSEARPTNQLEDIPAIRCGPTVRGREDQIFDRPGTMLAVSRAIYQFLRLCSALTPAILALAYSADNRWLSPPPRRIAPRIMTESPMVRSDERRCRPCFFPE